MIKLIIRYTLLLAVKILIGITFLFLIKSYIPIDTADVILKNNGLVDEHSPNYLAEYSKVYTQHKLDLPLFYGSILPRHHHSNINSIVDPRQRAQAISMQEQGYDLSEPNTAASTYTLKPKTRLLVPIIKWHGTKNQFHHYLSSLIKGDLGKSYKDDKPVSGKISKAITWTIAVVLLNLIASLILTACIIHVLMLYHPRWLSWIVDKVSVLIFAIPAFWLGTIVLVFFTTDQYGMPLFYQPLSIDQDYGILDIMIKALPKILPVVFCFTIVDVTYMVKMMKANLSLEETKPYVTTLKARGLSTQKIMYSHLLPNTMIPFVTLLAGGIPSALAGSLLFEVIFNIPGMGRLLYDSLYSADWYVVYGIVVVIMVTTTMVYTLADIAYKNIDASILTNKNILQ